MYKVANTLGFEVAAPTPARAPVPVPAITGPTAASLLETGVRAIPAETTPTPRPIHIQTPPLSQVKAEPVSSKVSEALEILTPTEEPETIEIIEEPEPIELPDTPQPIPVVEPEFISVEPEPIAIEGDDVDKGTLFEALQALGIDKGAAPEPQPTSDVDTQALMSALKPQPSTKQVPFSGGPAPAKPSEKPFTASPDGKGETDEDLFKISDKEAVLEALKVLGWEEPEK